MLKCLSVQKVVHASKQIRQMHLSYSEFEIGHCFEDFFFWGGEGMRREMGLREEWRNTHLKNFIITEKEVKLNSDIGEFIIHQGKLKKKKVKELYLASLAWATGNQFKSSCLLTRTHACWEAILANRNFWHMHYLNVLLKVFLW